MTEIPKDGLWFASVGGNPTEVIRISAGQMYSIGCADPHALNGVELIEMVDDMPVTAAGMAKKRRAWRARQERHFKKPGRYPSYRRFP